MGLTFQHAQNEKPNDCAVFCRFSRQANGQWLLAETSGLDRFVELTSIDCRLSLAEIYDKVEFGRAPGE
jgi:hypothetical protein